MANFKECEVGRIYDVEVNGKCVRLVMGFAKYGVRSTQEVRTKFPMKLALSKATWPPAYKYECIDWASLNQICDGAWVDIAGRVAQRPERDLSSSLPKLQVVLCSGSLTTVVDFLGGHADQILNEGTMVVLGGVRVKEYRQVRTLQTAYLTSIEIDPTQREGIPEVGPLQSGEPKQKAIRITPVHTMTVAELKNLTAEMTTNAIEGHVVADKDFSVIWKLSELNNTFFEGQTPSVGEEKEKACLAVNLSDASGEISMKLWDKACYELFAMTVSKRREQWELGVEEEGKRDEVLKTLNKPIVENRVRVIGVAKIWTYGFKEKKHVAQINGNYLELLELL